MPARASYDYAVIRVVPRVDREEFINAGVILFSKASHFLAASVQLDEERLRALSQTERFHWLAAPRSTIIQVSPVHGGLCDDPTARLHELFLRLVVNRA